jgi:hypothetical protein
MALSTLGGQLLRYGNALALSLACCCRRFCRTTRQDECGNDVYECDNQEAGSVGPCTPECRPPEDPCECGPNRQCEECFECIDGKCVRIEDCCTSDADCGPCGKCVDNVCQPCGTCEQCSGGLCLPCGPCQTCVDGVCVPCPEACVGGVCVPSQYYCCYDSCPGGEDSQGNPLPEPSTHCQNSPCGYGEDSNGDSCDLTKGGPYATVNLCDQNCQKYACVPDACGDRECVPDPDGPYNSMSECLQSCTEDPCSSPCSFSGGSGAGTYTIDACERDVCVSYISPDGKPIRVQIWGPTLDEDCNIIATRVIKADSDWRCLECCDCPDSPPRSNSSGDCEGGPVGQVTWTKPRGVTSFEVAVLTACGSSANIDVQACQSCTEYNEDDVDPCPCSADGDCNEGCHCCDGECQEEPCDEDECGPGVGCDCWNVDTYDRGDNFGNPLHPECDAIPDSEYFCGTDQEAVIAQAAAAATRRYAEYPNCEHTINGGLAYCCDGECQEVPCCQIVDGRQFLRRWFAQDGADPCSCVPICTPPDDAAATAPETQSKNACLASQCNPLP